MIHLIKAICVLFGTITGVAGGYVMGNLYPEYRGALGMNTDIKLAAILGGIGYLIFSLLLREFEVWQQRWVREVDFKKAIIGTFGAITGLLISNLFLLFPFFLFFNLDYVIKGLGKFSFIIPLLKVFLPLIFNLLGFYTGMNLMLRRQDDIISGITGIFDVQSKHKYREVRILDSSVIIDGRVSDIISSGFLPGKILIPRFVLLELQLLADSSDSLKRTRGRRGLDIADKLIKEYSTEVNVYYAEINSVKAVDEKLVELCKFLNATLVTNDLNLNKVASIQGISVLNINDLSNAVKPMFIPGDKITIKVMKKGKELGQGIGYLNDGTMVIIENGDKMINKDASVIVDSVMQTSAGRLVFAGMGSNGEKNNTNSKNIKSKKA